MIPITSEECNLIERLILELVHIKFNLKFISDKEIYKKNLEEYNYYNKLLQAVKLDLKQKYLINIPIITWYIDFEKKQIKYEKG